MGNIQETDIYEAIAECEDVSLMYFLFVNFIQAFYEPERTKITKQWAQKPRNKNKNKLLFGFNIYDIYLHFFVILKACEIDSIKIIRYESSIFYANVENFNYKILKKAGVNANEIIEKINKKKAEYLKKMNKINSKIRVYWCFF
jgi:DNA-directed RNA polymerase alpha subunit